MKIYDTTRELLLGLKLLPLQEAYLGDCHDNELIPLIGVISIGQTHPLNILLYNPSTAFAFQQGIVLSIQIHGFKACILCADKPRTVSWIPLSRLLRLQYPAT